MICAEQKDRWEFAQLSCQVVTSFRQQRQADNVVRPPHHFVELRIANDFGGGIQGLGNSQHGVVLR